MEFYHLRSFVAVAQTGNLTQAAKRLYTTPPAISAHIKALEEELATPLFIRSHKGMSLTDKGQLLLIKAQATLDSAVDLVNLAANNQHEIIGDFNLAINVSPKHIKLVRLIEILNEDCPGINLTVHSQPSGKTILDIQEGNMDGGYIFGDIPNDCVGITVLTQKITTVAPIKFDYNKTIPEKLTDTLTNNLTNTSAKTLTKADLGKLPWIMMGEHCPFDHFLITQLGEDIPAVLKTADDGTRLALVKSGVGLSFIELEEALIAKENKQVHIIKTLDFSIPLNFIVAKNRVEEPVIKTLQSKIKYL